MRTPLDRCKQWMLGGAASLLLSLPVITHAADVPWRDGMVVYTAKDKPLTQVLKDILATQAFPVIVKPDVRGTVNGQFQKPARAVFSDLEAAYGFTWYFDGSTMYIASSADNMSEVVSIAPLTGTQALHALADLGLIEPRFSVRNSGGSVLVTGPSRYVELVVKALESERNRASLALNQRSMSLVGSLARPSPGPAISSMEIRVFPLHYAQAQDSKRYLRGNDGNYVIPGVATLLRNLLKDSYAPSPAPDNKELIQGLAAGSALNALAPMPGQEGDTNDLRTQALLAFIAAQQRSVPQGNPAEGQLDRSVHIQADVRTNSVVIYDTPAMMPIYAQLIEQLDRPQRLVQLDVTIIDIDSEDVRDLGIDLSLRGGHAELGAGGQGLNFQSIGGGSLDRLNTRLTALQTHGRARVLSRPKIMTLDNTEAYMGNEQTYYIKASGDRYANVTPIHSGLSFRATPLVIPVDNEPARIKLTLEVDDGGFVDSNVEGVPGSSHKYLSTEAVVQDGQSLLVGGFQYENVGDNLSGVPGLSSVPGLGALFRRTRNSHQQVERLFLITPRVVGDQLNDTPVMRAMLPASPPSIDASSKVRPSPSPHSKRIDTTEFLNVWATPTRKIDTAPPAVLPVKQLPPIPNEHSAPSTPANDDPGKKVKATVERKPGNGASKKTSDAARP
ncbi:EscC/YscC/HrcC family type III secretion system outer membrane ring protein [Dyella monticola]|uniref:Type 3 secretion system secretin n=1 Tax=Dyella monticola TaxID=1927958 RepID=A0A370X3J0_9GAMM|nr:type III secretion system outer membrane ring subunit SctC [Dyella monticola]RDS82795.1 EscC/YscC/HrcC family type III secretion system outer membrane ring protein [Dyella monticola]